MTHCKTKRYVLIVVILVLILSGIYYYVNCSGKYTNTTNEAQNTQLNTTVITQKNMEITEKEKHSVKTQFYRWFQLYEREITDERIDNQLSILSDDIEITSSAGTMKGKESYPERLTVYKGWKNSHRIHSIDVTKNEESKYLIEAKVSYKNIMPDGKELNYQLMYNTVLSQLENDLPLFDKITITQVDGTDGKEFEDMYVTNRVNSLMYNWLYNMEQLDGNVEPFKEMLAEGFELNFSSGNINSIEALETWLKGTPTMLKSSVHKVENLSIIPLKDNTYNLFVDFVWTGVTKDGAEMSATTHHEWEIIDNINDKFAKIKTVNVNLK